MSLNLDRQILERAFFDPLPKIKPIDPEITGEEAIEAAEKAARREAASLANKECKHLATFIITNATNAERVEKVLAIKPILSLLRLSAWDIAKIACDVDGRFDTDSLKVISNTIATALPNGRDLTDLTKSDLRNLSRLLIQTQRLMDAQAEKVKAFIEGCNSLQFAKPAAEAEKSREESSEREVASV